ncbi:MAG: MoxR family ATPase [Candidatus Schekmanbacteria bacterium]|nr:MAG: MoxR family ATPase [Candidatus Schekmanbacteria bacterium]
MDSSEKINNLISNLEKAIIGKRECLKLVVAGLIARGHILIEDVPGVGKTTLARALAKSLDCKFRRIQFTPDMLPSDIIGISVFQQENGDFSFRKGPIFSNIVLADEINRATPRTQSSLLEAMNDYQVSVDGITYQLPNPFVVMATQNPVEFEGTFPLPESQLDRFLLRVSIGYPTIDDEAKVMTGYSFKNIVDELTPVLKPEDVISLQNDAENILISESLVQYILNISDMTRKSELIELGVSPRGNLAFYKAVKAYALVEGRNYCIPDDIKKLTVPVLAHRIIPKGSGLYGDTENSSKILKDILSSIPVPE